MTGRIGWSGLLALLFAGAVLCVVLFLLRFDADHYRAELMQSLEEASGRPVSIAGPLELDWTWPPQLSVSGVRIGNAPWGSRADMLVLDRAAIRVALLPLLRGDLTVRRLTVSGLDVLLEVDAAGRGNWEPPATPPAVGPATEPSGRWPEFHRVDVDGFDLAWRDARSGRHESLHLERFRARQVPDAAVLDLRFAFTYAGEFIEGEGTVGTLRALDGPEPFPLTLDLSLDGERVAIQGQVADPLTLSGLDLKLATHGQRLDRLGALAGFDLPPLSHEFSMRLAGGPAAFRLEDVFLLAGRSDLSGSVTLTVDGERPHLAAVLEAVNVDLGALIPPRTGPAADRSGALFGTRPLPLRGLAGFDAVLELDVRTLRWAGMLLTDLGVEATLDGAVGRTQFGAGLADGNLAGTFELDLRRTPAALHSRLDITDMDVGRLLHDAGREPDLRTRVDATWQLAARGASAREWASSLNGSVLLVGSEGRIRNQALESISTDLLGALAPFLEQRDSAALNCLVGRFRLENGVAVSDGLLFDTQTMTLAGAGSVDLGLETFDLLLTPRPKQPGLMNLAVPMRVSGPLADPVVRAERGALARRGAGLALVAINPLVALVPVVTMAFGGGRNPCLLAVEEAHAGPATAEGDDPEARSGLGGFVDAVRRRLLGNGN